MPVPMNWSQLTSTKRFRIHADGSIAAIDARAPNPSRSEFQIDQDRVIFSSAFRRLGRKTQVHPFAEHDHTHNRLTHSVEVASIGRSLGNRVGEQLREKSRLPNDIHPTDLGAIVQVACLAHDLGNPPFGHAGENALREWFVRARESGQFNGIEIAPEEFADLLNYEGNAHSLRTVASLEMHCNQGGMQLTAASLGALVKYPWSSNRLADNRRHKFNLYRTELPLYEVVAEELGLPRNGDDECWARHPLSYLMEAADDICYALLDLEDAQELELISLESVTAILAKLLNEQEMQRRDGETDRQYLAHLRGQAIGKIIDGVAQTFLQHEAALLRGDFAASDLIAVAPAPIRETIGAAKDFARCHIFPASPKLVMEIASYSCLGVLLDLLIPAALTVLKGRTSHREALALRLLDIESPINPEKDSPYLACMKVLDFVGGITDNTAVRISREISGVLLR